MGDAFTERGSTVSALISTTQTWFNATDCSKTGKMGVHTVFIDFHKKIKYGGSSKCDISSDSDEKIIRILQDKDSNF